MPFTTQIAHIPTQLCNHGYLLTGMYTFTLVSITTVQHDAGQQLFLFVHYTQGWPHD